MSGTERSALEGIQLDLRRADVTEVRRARRAAGEFLAGSPEDTIAIAQLLTSELVSNAMEHTSGSIRVSFDCADGVLRVRVRDESAHEPVVGRPLVSDLRGRGLLMVESLAMAWGVAPDLLTGGKTVWFRLRTA